MWRIRLRGRTSQVWILIVRLSRWIKRMIPSLLVAHFQEHTRQKKYFKYINRRFQKLDYTCHHYSPPHSHALLSELAHVSQAWLEVPGRNERQFVLGRFSPEYLQAAAVFIVRDASYKAVAFVNDIVSFTPDRATIDLMRYDPSAPNGVMDFLFLRYLDVLAQQGTVTFNLGFVPFNNATPLKDLPMETRALQYLLAAQERLFSFGGLRAFKSKYAPTWESRYLVYEGSPVQLVPLSLAIYKAVR